MTKKSEVQYVPIDDKDEDEDLGPEESDDLLTAVKRLTRQVRRLNSNVGLNHRQNVRTRRLVAAISIVGTALVAVIVLLAVGFFLEMSDANNVSRLANDEANRTACIQRWADATTARTSALTKTTNARNDAVDNLLVALSQPGAIENPTIVQTALKAYKKAEAQYLASREANPVPPAPKFTCS